MIFLIATIAIGPGLIVNLGFKDHWHRPRPVHTQEFGGPDEFRPWYDDRRRLQEELLVRLGRGRDRLLDGRPCQRAAAALARPRDRRRLRFRRLLEPAPHGLRRPLSLRRAARRAHLADRHRNRAAPPLAARRRMTPLRSPGNETGTEAIRTGHDGRAETRLARREPPAYKPALAASRGLVGV